MTKGELADFEEDIPLRLTLTLRSARGTWQLCFDHSPLVIGRSERCDVHLPFPWVSLQHAELRWSEEGICARDLHAKSPARIQGEPLSAEFSPPSDLLALSLPGLSIQCSLSSVHKVSERSDHALITRQIWRAESGWLLWMREAHHGTARPRVHRSNERRDQTALRPPEPLLCYPWRSAHRESSSATYSEFFGRYWTLGESGSFEIYMTSGKSHLIEINERGVNLDHTHHGDLSGGPISWTTEHIHFALSRESKVPIHALISDPKNESSTPSWWSRLWQGGTGL